jgi:hypothetical protein
MTANAREEQQMSNENDEQNRAEVDEGCLGTQRGIGRVCHCPSCAPNDQPAGEHHAGTLDLTGEGNAPANPIPPAAVTALATSLAWSASWDTYSEATHQVLIACALPQALAALEAAYPAIRQQVAEEIAAKAEAIANDFQTTALSHKDLSSDKETPKQQMHWRTAVAYRNKADGAWAVAAEVRVTGGAS